MACLSDQQLGRLALGLTEDAEQTAHIKECASCRARGETMQSLVHQLTAAHAKFDSGHEEARERLTALLPANRPLEPGRIRNRISHWIGELSMRQRMALGGVGVVAVFAIIFVWIGSTATPVSAMEQMAENIRKAKSFKTVIAMEGSISAEPGKPPITQKTTGTLYWLAPESSRWDFKDGPIPKSNGGTSTDREHTEIFVGKKTINIDHKDKTFIRNQAKTLNRPVGLEMMEKLGEFSGHADRELGTKNISGKKARGFEIDIKKLSKQFDGYGPLKGMAEIWIDTESSLPVLLHVQFNSNTNQAPTENVVWITRFQDFQWNIDLDPKLFEPPEGYTDDGLTVEYCIRRYTGTLSQYAELTGGRYPQGLKDIPEAYAVIKELYKISGFEYPFDKVPPELEHNEKFQKVLWVAGGLGQIASFIKFTNEDAAYYGKTVGPNEKDKVLLRWKLDDGKYEVIFGDLRAETVTAEQLRALEGK